MAHAIQALLSHYDAAYRRAFGEPAPIAGAKDAALAKRLLSRYEAEKLYRWIDLFFQMPDPWIQQSGYSFGVFSSQIGKVIAWQKQDVVKTSPRMARSLRAIYGDE